MKKTAVQEFGLEDRRREIAIQEHGNVENIASVSSFSSLDIQIPEEQMQTFSSPYFFTGLQNNDFSTKAMITNVAGNLIIKDETGLFSDTEKITADMIASVTPALPSVFKGREELVTQGVDVLCQRTLRFLAILGAGGMGKTSLPLHIMDSDLVKTKFSGRRYFIPCELFEDAESLVLGLIHVMELTIQENRTPLNHGDSRIGVKNLLEKIANFEKVSLIITMQGPDGPGDIRWEKLGDKSGIPTLLPAPAKVAFKAFASNNLQISGDSESQIDSLLCQLEYVPLAIRLSAQHIKRVPLKALIRMWEKDKTSILAEPTKPGRLTSVSFSIAKLSIQIFRVEGRTLKLLSAISFLPDGISFWVEYLHQMFPGEGLNFNVSTLLDSSLINVQNEGMRTLAPVREHIHSQYPIGQNDLNQFEGFYAQFPENIPNNNMQAQPLLQLHINNIEKLFKAQMSGGHSRASCISAMNILQKFTKFDSLSIGLIDLILERDRNIDRDDKVELELKKANRLRWVGRFKDAEAQEMSVKECLNEEVDISQSEAYMLGRYFYILRGIYYAQAQYEGTIDMNLRAQKYFVESKNQ
ncbi:hypothetical protein K435DRAFT_854110 [Dendrothele bispora CBS 962.96]|uniref:NB-ARC domain-containing protein n=1 Tax=Dendrothele bispora (strain CBS 962.96) TaxID=1314807 RepID=A0A4S8MFB0_DENBC|nr:hypothetical protein K435DRAFT_854110 [Dendrothele bispora CBS 962.96]